jgi:hypothetical protein
MKRKTVTQIWKEISETESKHLSHDNWTDDDMMDFGNFCRMEISKCIYGGESKSTEDYFKDFVQHKT